MACMLPRRRYCVMRAPNGFNGHLLPPQLRRSVRVIFILSHLRGCAPTRWWGGDNRPLIYGTAPLTACQLLFGGGAHRYSLEGFGVRRRVALGYVWWSVKRFGRSPAFVYWRLTTLRGRGVSA